MRMKRIKAVFGAFLAATALFSAFPFTRAEAGDWFNSGYAEGAYYIRSDRELREFSDIVNGVGRTAYSFEGETVYLASDINLQNSVFKPIGWKKSSGYRVYEEEQNREESAFKGCFDGMGYTVSGLNVSEERGVGGLFAYAENAEIKNLTVRGHVTAKNHYSGGIVGFASGKMTLENCVSEVYLNGSKTCGGILGYIQGSADIVNCKNRADISSCGSIGGIVGYISGHGDISKIEGCANRGRLTAIDDGKTAAHEYGGIAGEVSNTIISDCRNFAEVYAASEENKHSYIGGIVGDVGYFSTNDMSRIERCMNFGTVSGVCRTGGIAGLTRALLPGSVRDCLSAGDVYALESGGGLIGDCEVEALSCLFAGRLILTGDDIDGGFHGLLGDDKEQGVNCYALPNCVIVNGKPSNPEPWAEIVSDEELKNGTLAFLLDGGEVYERSFVWTQGENYPEPSGDREKIELPSLYVGAGESGEAEIVFCSNYGEGEVTTQAAVKFGESVPEPKPPEREDKIGTEYKFGGWYLEPWCETEAELEKGFLTDTTLYARWDETDLFDAGDTAETAVVISSAEELRALAEKVYAGKEYTGKYFKLGADITLDEKWDGIGAQRGYFNADFDGDGHTVTLENAKWGIFNFCGKESLLHDFKIVGVMDVEPMPKKYMYYYYYPHIGALVNYTLGKISNCTLALKTCIPEESGIFNFGGFAGYCGGDITGSRVLAGTELKGFVMDYAGGIAGEIKGDIKSCQNSGALNISCKALGGIAGLHDGHDMTMDENNEKYIKTAGVIDNCHNFGGVENLEGAASGLVGGTSNGEWVSIKNSTNTGKILGGKIAAGVIAAYAIDNTSNYGTGVTVKSCSNGGEITAENGSAGGIFGSTAMSGKPSLGVEIIDSQNSGDVSGAEYVGGIAAMFDSLYGGMGADGRELAKVEGCSNSGNISSSGDYAGGILGANTWYGDLTLTDSTNSGNVSGVNFVGGIAGYINHDEYDNTAENVSSSGNITATGSYVGGLLGYGDVRNGYWSGEKISVSEDSRFVSELVGDVRSRVIDSGYEYTQPSEEKQPELGAGNITIFKPENDTASKDEKESLKEQPVYIQPEKDNEKDDKDDIEADKPINEINPSGKATVFEIVRNTVAENPIILISVCAAVILIILISGLHRYRKNKKTE